MKRIFALLLSLLLPAVALAEEPYIAEVTLLTSPIRPVIDAAYIGDQVITITCAGDTILGSSKRVQTKYKKAAFQAYIDQYGYAYPFQNVLSLTASDDITLLNLESVLYTPKTLNTSKQVCNGPAEYAGILAQGSVEVVNLANDHIDDYGKQGYQSTLEALDAAGVKYSGETDLGRELCWFDFDNDVRIGFIGLIPAYYADNTAKVKQDFQKLKQEGCDVIIASIHCGQEGSATHSQMQDRYRKIAVENGAHIVVGTHPHVPQGLWVENGVTTLNSLGNFIFGGSTGVDEAFTNPESLIAQIDLHFKNGQYTGHQVTLWPIMITGQAKGSGTNKKSYANDYSPILAQGEEAQAIMKKVQKDTKFKLNPYADGVGAVQEFVPWIGTK